MMEFWPFTNFHDLNLDWIVKKIRNVEDSEAAAKASEEAAADSARSASSAMGMALVYQNKAKNYRDDAQGFANDAQSTAENINDVREQIDTNTARINNLVANAGDTDNNAELLDIRVGIDGTVYPTAGDAVRLQIQTLKDDTSISTDNNIIEFKPLVSKIVNGVTINTGGDGMYSLSGTATSNGGRTIKLTDVFHLSAGTYTFSFSTTLNDCYAYLNFSNDTMAGNIENGYPSRTLQLIDGDYYFSLGFTNGSNYNGTIGISLLDGSIQSPEFVRSITAYDVYARKQIENLGSEIDNLEETTELLTVFKTVEFEQGTIAGNGGLNPNANRIRSIDYYPSNFIEAIVDSDHFMWVAQYDENRTFLRIDNTNKTRYTPEDFLQDVKYVKFVLTNGAQNTPIVPEDETGFSLSYTLPNDVDNEFVVVDEKYDNIGKNRYYSSFKSYSFILQNAYASSDATIVDDNYVTFSSGDDELTTSAQMLIYEYANGFENNRTNLKTLYHRFGHCNSVDYSPINDCLIVGNGSGQYNLDGKIYIIPDFRNIVLNDTTHTSANNPLTLTNTNAIVIDCTTYDLGTKFNVIWGELNNTKQDIAYLITAKYGSSTTAPDAGDNGTIRRLLLGTGSNQFEYGAYNGASGTAFNGTFKILETYTQNGTSYTQCNQGCCYHNAKIYSAIGHDGLWLWEMWLDKQDNKIWYDEYKQVEYSENGQVLVNNSSSVCKSDKYIFFGQENTGVLVIPIDN